MEFAHRVAKIHPFQVMEVLARAQELESAGHRVVHFEVGEPDFATADPIVAAGRNALANGHTKYTNALGIMPLREAIARYYARMNVQVDPDQIVVTSGASGGLTLLAGLLLNPGDELLITDPGYPCNEVFARLTGAIPRAIAVSENNGFQPTVELLEAHWTKATRGALLASPANPTGTMLDLDLLNDIAAMISARSGFFILDEIYQGITRDAPYETGLAVSRELFVLNSFSKFFGMTGWRLGWIVAPRSAMPGITKLAQNLFISPSAPAQYAAIAAFGDAAMAIHQARAERFAQRAEQLTSGLVELGFRIPVRPQGAFYLYVDVSHTGLVAREFCWRLLDEFHVACTPGEDFGQHQHERFVRFAFTTDEGSIALGLERLADALQAWGIR